MVQEERLQLSDQGSLADQIDERTAEALGLTSLDRRAVAQRLAEIGELRAPARRETEEFLLEVFLTALSYIPRTSAAWSWGEFYNGGIQPLYDISREEDWARLGLCALDLGLGDEPVRVGDGELVSPRVALAKRLMEATEKLLRGVTEQLETAGFSPYGHRGR